MKICFAAVAALLLCTAACGQRFSFGVLGGAPLSDTNRSGFNYNRFGSGPWSVYTHPYTVGPAFEFALPLPFRFYVEVDALYTRINTENHYFFNPLYGNIVRQAANSWAFPMVLKYRSDWRFRPFAALGGTFRRIGEVGASQETFAYGLPTPYGVDRYHIDESLTQGGIAAAGGLTAGHVGPLKLVPELRYTHWTSIRFFPTQNQVEFLLGVTF